MSKPDPKLQGTHNGDGGQVQDGSCKKCGADFIDPKNIKQGKDSKGK